MLITSALFLFAAMLLLALIVPFVFAHDGH
jgi:hypothetical protein